MKYSINHFLQISNPLHKIRCSCSQFVHLSFKYSSLYEHFFFTSFPYTNSNKDEDRNYFLDKLKGDLDITQQEVERAMIKSPYYEEDDENDFYQV